MRLKSFISKNEIDEALLFNQAKALDDTILGENTWLFFENPLVEGEYYDVTNGLSEDEINHFSLLRDLINEDIESDSEEMSKIKEPRKFQSWMGKEEKEKNTAFKDSKKMSPKSDWDKEVEAAYKDITKKSRKVFHDLDELGKKSFVIKYILHGMEAKIGEEGWGRDAGAGRKKPKEIYADSLKGYKEKQKFAKDVIAMMKQEEEKKKEALRVRNETFRKFKSLESLEDSLLKSKDTLTQKLMAIVRKKYVDGHFKNEDGYLEMLLLIKAKQYNSTTEINGCIKQWSAYENNDKTWKSIDLSTVCPKRMKLKEMREEYGKAAKDLQDAIDMGASESTISRLRKRKDSLKITDANNPTCAYCYVEQGREAQEKNPNFLFGKEEKEGQVYQGTFKKWIKKDKGQPMRDKDGNFVLTGVGKKNVETLNRMGGLRFFSSGDYIEDQATDQQIEKIIKDAAKVGLQLKAITKQEKFVTKYGGRVFEEGPLKGKPVFHINMSVDEQRGFKLINAKRLKRKYPGNVNIRVVALNPKQAIEYSKDPDVDVITLLHFSSRGSRMKNKDVYVDMSPGSVGWKQAIEGMKEANPKENWNKILTKLCCAMDGKGDCRKCPNACGFNPNRVSDFVSLAKGGKMRIKAKDIA